MNLAKIEAAKPMMNEVYPAWEGAQLWISNLNKRVTLTAVTILTITSLLLAGCSTGTQAGTTSASGTQNASASSTAEVISSATAKSMEMPISTPTEKPLSKWSETETSKEVTDFMNSLEAAGWMEGTLTPEGKIEIASCPGLTIDPKTGEGLRTYSYLDTILKVGGQVGNYFKVLQNKDGATVIDSSAWQCKKETGWERKLGEFAGRYEPVHVELYSIPEVEYEIIHNSSKMPSHRIDTLEAGKLAMRNLVGYYIGAGDIGMVHVLGIEEPFYKNWMWGYNKIGVKDETGRWSVVKTTEFNVVAVAKGKYGLVAWYGLDDKGNVRAIDKEGLNSAQNWSDYYKIDSPY